jgi:transcriptional regulator with XRE-family HTH domain
MASLDSGEDGASKRLGRKLRESRIAAGYRNQQEFGAAMNMHRTTVTKIESGARQVGSEVLRQWCELCHVDFELYEASARLAWVAQASPVPLWFQDFFRAQVLAHTIRTWHPIIIPGPLQTPDYARALHEGAGIPDDLIEDRVAARIDLQQQTIERRPVPVRLIAVMDEAVLHRRVGSEDVRYKQLTHLAEQGQRKHIGIQVVPACRGANAGHVGSFTIASMDDADVMLMGAVEDVTTDKRPAIRAGLAIFDRVRLGTLRPGEH